MTTFTDDFARADSTALGNSWSEVNWRITSGAAVPESTTTALALGRNMSTGDQYAEIKIGNTYGGSFVGPAVRMPTLNTGPTDTGAFYLLFLTGSSGTAFSIRRHEANSSTTTVLGSASTTSDVRAEGLTMRLRCYDDPDVSGRVVLEGYVNGAKLLTAYDTSGGVPNTQRGVGMWASGTGATSLRIAQFASADQAAPAAAGGSADTTPPAVPTGLALTTPDYGQIRASWTAVSDAARYLLYRSTGGTVTTSDTLVGTPSDAFYLDDGLTGGTTYRYAVLAEDAAGNRSALSTSVTKTATTAPTGTTANTGATLARWDQTTQTLTQVYLGRPVWTTAGRPAASSVPVGFSGYDSTLGIPIWSNGTNWRNASGTTV